MRDGLADTPPPALALGQSRTGGGAHEVEQLLTPHDHGTSQEGIPPRWISTPSPAPPQSDSARSTVRIIPPPRAAPSMPVASGPGRGGLPLPPQGAPPTTDRRAGGMSPGPQGFPGRVWRGFPASVGGRAARPVGAEGEAREPGPGPGSGTTLGELSPGPASSLVPEPSTLPSGHCRWNSRPTSMAVFWRPPARLQPRPRNLAGRSPRRGSSRPPAETLAPRVPGNSLCSAA
jgi:hypothetical protein